MALANSEATKEGRLALLSAFARRFSERNGTPDAELLAYIKRLIDEVDMSAMGDTAMKIAADVLMFDPDAAIGIIEAAVKGQPRRSRMPPTLSYPFCVHGEDQAQGEGGGQGAFPHFRSSIAADCTLVRVDLRKAGCQRNNGLAIEDGAGTPCISYVLWSISNVATRASST